MTKVQFEQKTIHQVECQNCRADIKNQMLNSILAFNIEDLQDQRMITALTVV